MDHNGQQQQEEQRRQEECPAHPDRPVSEGFVWVHRAGKWHREYRCTECIIGAQNMAVSEAIKLGTDWRHNDRYDMRYFSDHPRYTAEPRGLK